MSQRLFGQGDDDHGQCSISFILCMYWCFQKRTSDHIVGKKTYSLHVWLADVPVYPCASCFRDCRLARSLLNSLPAENKTVHFLISSSLNFCIVFIETTNLDHVPLQLPYCCIAPLARHTQRSSTSTLELEDHRYGRANLLVKKHNHMHI